MGIKMIERIGVVEKRICKMNGKKIVVLVGEECLGMWIGCVGVEFGKGFSKIGKQSNITEISPLYSWGVSLNISDMTGMPQHHVLILCEEPLTDKELQHLVERLEKIYRNQRRL